METGSNIDKTSVQYLCRHIHTTVSSLPEPKGQLPVQGVQKTVTRL